MIDVNGVLGKISIDKDKYECCAEPEYYEKYKDIPVMERLACDAGKLQETIISEIDRGNPLIVLYGDTYGGHFIVVTGYKIVNNKMTVYFNDPDPDPDPNSPSNSIAKDPNRTSDPLEKNVTKSRPIEEMKGYYSDAGYNYKHTYSVKKYEERIDY